MIDVGGHRLHLSCTPFGGLYVLSSAARYPEEVAGMVLVDSTAPASAAKPTAAPPAHADPYDLMGRVSALASTSARLGLSRLVGIPTESHLRSTIDEYVLTAGIGSSPVWSTEQEALATLSTDSVHRVIKGTDHAAMIAEAQGAAATTRAILDVVSSVRNAAPLAK